MVWSLPVLTFGLLALGGPPEPAHVPRLVPRFNEAMLTGVARRVRAATPRVQELLVRGAARSRTFADLIAAVSLTDVIVYVETVPDLPGAIAGRLLLVPVGGPQRYLRIQLQLGSETRDAIALIGHELRHALEVADALDVKTQHQLIELYKRIGTHSTGSHSFDTAAAQETGRKIRGELT